MHYHNLGAHPLPLGCAMGAYRDLGCGTDSATIPVDQPWMSQRAKAWASAESGSPVGTNSCPT